MKRMGNSIRLKWVNVSGEGKAITLILSLSLRYNSFPPSLKYFGHVGPRDNTCVYKTHIVCMKYNHATSNLAIYSNETSQDKLSEA